MYTSVLLLALLAQTQQHTTQMRLMMQAVMRIRAATDAALMMTIICILSGEGSRLGLDGNDDDDGRARDEGDTDEGVGVSVVSSKMKR